MTPDTERMVLEALRTCHAWVDRWAQHIGRCKGGDKCICGRTVVEHEARAALSAADREAQSGGEDGLAKKLRETTRLMATRCNTPIGLWQEHSTSVLQAAATIDRLTRKLDDANDRLENNRYYDIDGNLHECEPGTIPDGITCRDETIKMQDERIERLTRDCVCLKEERDRLTRELAEAREAIEIAAEAGFEWPADPK